MPITETVTPRGRIVLGGTTFTCDPETYEPWNWAKRHSVHPVIGGGVTIQDFGTYAKDNTVRIGSGRYLIDSFVADALHTKYRTAAATYTLTDWMSNTFVVFITNFRAWPNFVGPLWAYEMELQVISISFLLGQAYTGS